MDSIKARLRFLGKDPLTELPTRAGLLEVLGGTNPAVAALLRVDLEDFRMLDDALGQGTGDPVLVETARRLRTLCEPGALVARVGVEAFAVLLPAPLERSACRSLAERILEALHEPYWIGDRRLCLRARAGLALREDASTPGATLLQQAGLALDQGRRERGPGVTLYREEIRARAIRRLSLASDLDRAVRRGEFRLLYQPIVDGRDGRTLAYEALLRWAHPRRGLLIPQDFLEAARHDGVLTRLRGWCLSTALGDLARWRRLHPAYAHLRVHVNFCCAQLRSPGVLEEVSAALSAAALLPEALCVELTEESLASGLPMEQVLDALAALGVQIHIDDFGTGYSSLCYLTRFPVRGLKIDRSFIEPMRCGEAPDPIVRSIIALARSLRLHLVAEGVETVRQRDVLLQAGCTQMQGFFFARPLEAREVTALLSAGARSMRHRPALRAPGPTLC